MQRRSIHWSLSLGQTAFGLILAGLALIGAMLFNRPHDAIADQLDRLAPLTRAALLEAPAARDVLIEGRVSERNESLGNGLVAYASERSVVDIRGDTIWVADESVTPPLVIEMADGSITTSGNYSLYGDMPVVTEGARRLRGLSAGDEVVIIGRPTFDNSAEQILPDSVIRGSRESYPRPGFNLITLGVAIVLMAVGAGIMAWLLRRGYSPFGNPDTGR
ncbi:MAG TPA: hypothetical protein VD886_00855 [Herpetosiphonaceae bacterium]|nr:hypothetical protein [Herpetosiphonaceae bacterium]